MISLVGFALQTAGEAQMAKGVTSIAANGLFVHLRNDKTLRYRMHGKAQDAVVARFGQDLRNVTFYRAFAQIQLSCNFLTRFCFADQSQDADFCFIERRSV